MQTKLVVSSSPFLRDASVSTRRLMGDVVIALIPTALAAIWFFGAPALALMLVSVVFAVLSELVYEKITHQKTTIDDLSAVVTGLLLAFNLPANAPWWMAAIGSIIAIVLVKQMFGGIGQNFINPALAARTILMLSWAGLIAATALPAGGQLFGLTTVPVDAVASATPLVSSSYSLWQLFIGDIPGMLGETCKLTLILGGVYLIVRKVIDWRIPVFFIATAFILFWIQTGVIYSVESGTDNALYQIPDSIQMVTLGALRGYNDTRAIFIVAFLSYWGVSLPVGYMLCFHGLPGMAAMGVKGFWIGFIVGLCCSAALYLFRLARLEHLTPEELKAKLAK